MTNNENKITCSSCQGKCCKNMGCHYSPDDFERVNFNTLKSVLDEGNTSIDWWEGDITEDGERSRTYYLRMRNKNGSIIDPSWGGECILLTEKGCPLPFLERPLGGKALIPSEKGLEHCKSEYTKEECCKDWYQYQDLFEQLINSYINEVA